MKCDLCGADQRCFLRVRHRERGIIFVCERCFAKERAELGSLPDHAGCGCRPY